MTTRVQSVTWLAAVVFAVLAGSSPAAAHTGFESSSPGDGDVIDAPVDEITVTFTGEAAPAGEGFVVLDPTGVVLKPDEVGTTDNLTWVLRFDEPIAGGDVGVRWSVAAPDAHPIEGSFSFTVTSERPSPDDQTPAPGEPAAPVDPEEPTSAEPSESAAEDAAIAEPATGEDAAPATSEPIDLPTFLETGDTAPVGVGAIDAAARILSVLGAVLVIGGAAFAAFGLRGDPRDVRAVLFWVRRGGAVLLIGAAIQAVTTTTTSAGAWSAVLSPGDLRDALWSSVGLAIALRAVGGFVAASRIGLGTTPATAVGDPIVAARQLAVVGGGPTATSPVEHRSTEPFVYAEDRVWDHRLALGGLVGIAMVTVSFVFDGHTAAEGPRWLHAIANIVHVTTAAIWGGGVAMLALTIRRRHRRGGPTRALQLAVRFSVLATGALVAAGLAGLALSIVVLDSVSDIWTTPWGRLLAVKVALVAVAAIGGAYNHRVVVPALERDPDHQPTIDRFRSVVTVEAVVLVAVAVVTALLIGASTT